MKGSWRPPVPPRPCVRYTQAIEGLEEVLPVTGGEMESVTSLLSGAWEWIKGLDPTSDAGRRHRDGVRRKLTDEFAKPAGERDEKRLQALLWEDTRLHGVYYNVSGLCTVGPHAKLFPLPPLVAAACCDAAACGPPPPAPTLRCHHFPCSQCMGRYWEEEATHHLELSKRRDGCGCCTPSARVQARAAAFYTAAAAFYSAVGSQALEELRAIDAGRPAVLWELPTFQPELPASWVQHPPGRLEMCKECALDVEEVGERAGGRIGRAGGRVGGWVGFRRGGTGWHHSGRHIVG